MRAQHKYRPEDYGECCCNVALKCAFSETLKSSIELHWIKNDAMSILISDATINDLDALYNIEKECFTLEAFTKELIATLLQKPDAISLLAEIRGVIVGFAIALIHQKKNRKIGHVFTIDVATRARKGGVGIALMKNLEQKLIERGAKSCYLEVRVDNTAARKLYKQLGYSETRIVKDFYYLGGDCIVMRKDFQ